MRGSRPATYALRLRERKPATFAGTKVGGGGLARPEGPRVRAGASIVRPGFISQMGEGVATRSDALGRHGKREVEAAGFILVAEGDFLRHPEDKRDPLSSRA